MNPLALIPFVEKIIDRVLPDPEKAAKAKLDVAGLIQSGKMTELKESVKVIVAEATSDSWLARNWRPVTMLTFVVIIANNYILYPYLSLFFNAAPKMEIPPDMWDLLKIGLGGYVVGRSAEKTVGAYAASKEK